MRGNIRAKIRSWRFVLSIATGWTVYLLLQWQNFTPLDFRGTFDDVVAKIWKDATQPVWHEMYRMELSEYFGGVLYCLPAICAGVVVFVTLGGKQDEADQPRCLHCGYSLRGSTSGYCPECGSNI